VFFLLGLANFKLYKIKIFDINKLVEDSKRIESMNLEEISQLEYSKNKENSQKSEEVRQEIIQTLSNKNLLIQNLIFVSNQISDKLRTFNFLKKLHLENCLRPNIYQDDYTAFEYKSKQIELIRFVIESDGRPPNINYDYFCIRFENSKNPRNVGQIAIEKDFNWRFKWNYEIKEKIKKKNIKLQTGNSDFDQIFNTTCTNEINARNYLTNQKLEKFSNLRQKLSPENTIFYLDNSDNNSVQNSDIYFIFAIENQWKPQQELSIAENSVNQLELVCEIFDNWNQV